MSSDGPLDDARANAAGLLRGLEVFGYPEGEQLAALVEAVEWLYVPAGQRVFSAGDPPDGMYVILSGRVRFFAETTDGPVLTAEVGAGISFGEGSLLVGGGRSRTAVVVRDALLARLAPERVLTTMRTSPELAMWIARMLAARVAFEYEPPPSSLAAETTVLVPLGSAVAEAQGFAADLAAAAHARACRAGDLVANDGVGEADGGGLIVVADQTDPFSLTEAVRQADRIIMVAAAREPPEAPRLPRLDQPGFDLLAAPPVELVLLHAAGTKHPSGTSAWLSVHRYARHHHLRNGDRRDLLRLVRHLNGLAIGLVFGGGGARGMAHIGVVKALDELGIPIDDVGGSSMGAIVGGEVAMGSSWEDMLEVAQRRWASPRLRLDVTLPTVSVFSGRGARRILDDTFGDIAIEDMWLRYFCTSVNLSRFRLAVHREGPAARWIRASASAPGLWPPVVDDDGELHIDGGQLNNVPTDVMRLNHQGPIIAVDVCAMQDAMTVTGGSEPPVGFRHLLRRRLQQRFPSLVDTLNRCALLGSLQHRERAADFAEIYLTPDLAAIGFSGFGRIAEAVDIGYRATMDALGDGGAEVIFGKVE